MNQCYTRAHSILVKGLILIIFLLISQAQFCQNKFLESSGDALLFILPTAALSTTVLKKDKQGTWQFLKGFVVNAAVTTGLKYVINKQRPNAQNLNSFPSGHTSVTFQSASFIHRRYGPEYGVPAYILAGYTGFTRVSEQKHDLIDIVAGAVIGMGTSYLLTTPYQQEHMKITFSSNKGDFLFGFKYEF